MAILSLYPLPRIVYTHDGSATLISEGNVLYSYEEEKLSRFQHAISEFPEKSAVVGFQQTGIHPTQVESLVVTSIENCLARPDFASRVQFAKDLLLLRQFRHFWRIRAPNAEKIPSRFPGRKSKDRGKA
jgi:predicted NodU family carbamoyl transferase